MSAPDGDGGGGSAASPYKYFTSESEALKSAVTRWKGDPTDLGIHVQDEIDGLPPPPSGSGTKLREMASALLKEVKENSRPAPTLYRGDNKTTDDNSSALVGWSSNRRVAEKWADRYGGTLQTLEGASGVKLSDIVGKIMDTGEDEWIVLTRPPGGGGDAKPSWMGAVDAKGSTNHGAWFLEKNSKQAATPWRDGGDPATHVLSLVGEDEKVKAFVYADLSDDKQSLYMNYAEVAKPLRGQGVYKSLLDSLSEQFRVVSDEEHNVATAAKKAYESLGARLDRYGHYVLDKKKKREDRAFCATGTGGGIKNDCSSSDGGQSTKSFPAGSQPLRDAVTSVAPSPDAIWDRSKGRAETPYPKQMDAIADEQGSHSGAPLTPEAEASYAALVNEIGRQYEALTAAGLKARAWRGDGEPYGDPPGSTKPNSDKMRQEVAKTGEFSFFMTDKGFGTGDATPDHPMLRETKFKTADGEPMIANDLFRVVHDMVAHVRGGYSFSTNGEYNGMLTHASTLPEEAWPALFAETFGQNAVYEKTKQYAPQNAYASKVGPEIIRSELKKRTKSSRAAKADSDEPLGYQHIKSRPALLRSLASVESRGDAPAPKKDQIKGSDVNDEGSAKNKSGDISLDDSTISSLKKKVEEHNAAMREAGKPDWTHVRLPSLKAVYRRGAGAFSTSHRPGMTRERWAMARVNAFLTLARRGRPENAKYVNDNDLLHSSHPKHSREARSTDCGRDDEGRFTSGNKCGGQVDMPKEDPRGRMRYDNGVQTDAARKLYQMGSSEEKLKGLVEAMGGDPKNTTVDINHPSVNISVLDKSGNKLFHVDFDNGRARVYPTKDLSGDDVAKIKAAAKDAFPSEYSGKNTDFKVTVYRKAEDMKKWEAENAKKLQKWEDKYKFSTLLPPHQRPKKWERSIDARYASLLAFAESRDCGQDKDGKFSKGNTCASGVAADVAKGAAAGAVLGGVSAFGKTFTPQAAASGAAVGAVAGAVKGIYDNKMRPTRVSARIEKVGMTDEKVSGLVKGLGGTRKSVASVNGKNGLTLTIRGKNGMVSHVVDITSKKVTIYPRAGRRELTDDQIDSIKKLAADSSPKETSIVVKTNSLSYATRLAKKGFVVGAKQAGSLVATAVGSAAAPSIPDAVLGTADLVFDTHFTDSFYKSEKHAKR
jgi:hypothetical protein